MNKMIMLAAAAGLLLTSCQPKALVILHTNDTHSHLEAERGGTDAGHGGCIERAAFVDSVRAARGADNVLLVHAGDFNQGSSYYSEFGGIVEVNVVNDMKYDVIALGNHEFDNGIEDLTERLKKFKTTQVVCANLDLRSFELGEYVKPYAIVNRGGKKIGVIGLDTDITRVVSSAVSSRIPLLDNEEVTNRWSDYLKNTEKCDLIILLSHLGYDEDQAFIPCTHNIDLLIGGHSHTFVDDFIYVEDADGKKVPIITDGRWGLEMGEIEVR
ncbi:MAG: metallophosphoesterase [Bacteroidales bacterium]|nr:metallophosphoesterase [Bacteroidales bacterium]